MARCPTCHRRVAAGQRCPAHGDIGPAPVSRDVGATPTWSRSLGACLGSGGFATVWEIADGGVLKVAHADHELSRARIVREAEALAAVGPPAVPKLIGTGVLADGRPWVAMDKVAGKTLTERIEAGVKPADAIGIGLAILDALVRMHDAKLVHRDIKPDNLMLRADGRVVLLDLGLARKVPDDPTDPTRPDVQVGSLEYMAPEQIKSSATADARSDVYGFGCVLYELCSGRPPFVGDEAAVSRAHLALRPPALGALVTVTTLVEAVVMDCLAKDPAHRPQTAKAARDRLLSARGEVSSSLASHLVSMIAEGKQPVVLVWAELTRVDRALLATLQARRARVASQRGRRVIVALLGADHPDPAAAAIAVARDLVATGARVAMHLDALALAPGSPAGVALAGPAIEKPERWLPQGTWTGIALTRAVATVIQLPTRGGGELGAEFRILAEPGSEAQLFGRDAQLGDLAADAAAVLLAGRATPGPALDLMIGDPGVGKTTFAEALAQRIGELEEVTVHVGAVPPPGTGRPGYTALTSLIGVPDGPIVRTVGDALRAIARRGPLAVILDDLHNAEHELLDALEYATLGGEPLRLWVIGIASGRFDARRPGFGRRAERHRRDVLAVLDEDASVAMAAALLRPAEYPPVRALRQLAALTRGNPMHMSALVKDIHERGAIRQRPNGEHFLDTAALDTLAPTPLGAWLAARLTQGLGDETVSLGRLCAVLGDDFSRAELVGVMAKVEAAGGATSTVDVDVGLGELVGAGVIVPSERGWRFPQTLVMDGLYSTTDEAARRAVHLGALAYWTAHAGATVERLAHIARHAEASEDVATAFETFAQLGKRAHQEHRVFDADLAWAGALRMVGDGEGRARALLGRARTRYRLMRLREALADLDEVQQLARAGGDRELELDVHLDRGTALDLMSDYDGSQASLLKARAALSALPADRADAYVIDVELGEARSIYRRQDLPSAVVALDRVAASARVRSRRDVETTAGVMRAPALVALGSLDAAAAVFDEVMTLCRREGDNWHLGAAYANRTVLWSARGEVERTVEDLRQAIQIAREDSFSGIEWAATHNLAEDRLWQGALDEAMALAQRSLSLQRDHAESIVTADLVLVARIQAMQGLRAELAITLQTLRVAELTPAELALCAVLACTAHELPRDDWDRAVRDATALVDGDVRIEIGFLAARNGMLTADEREEVRAEATRHPIWSRRAEEL